MKYYFLDFETYFSSDFSLRKMTVPEYLLSPLFAVHGCAIKPQGQPAKWHDAEDLPAFFASLDPDDTCLIYHNALFDASIVAWIYGFVPRLTGDTLAVSRAVLGHELKSLALGSVAMHLGVGVKGDTILKVQGMNSHAIKQAGLWGQYTAYAENDAEQCANIWEELVVNRKFPPRELVLIDKLIRCAIEPKFRLDPNVLHLHLAEVKAKKEALLHRVGLSTRDDLMSNDKFAAALMQLGVEPPRKTSLTTGKETWAFAKTDPGFIELEEHDNPEVQALAAARLGVKTTLEETRTERFIRFSQLPWPQGEPMMPFPLRYGGAHTHRLSGDWKLNLQNLPRGGNLRRALTAPKGFKIIAPDSSQIEARVAAWLGGEQELLEAFREKRDVYSEFASEVFGYPVSKKMKKERFVGKTCLAEGTLILTNEGLVPIEKVTTQHKLWDGVEWVSHAGLINNGLKNTLTLCGVSLTPDHRVWCGTQWQEAQSVARDENTLSRALATAAVNLPSQVISQGNEAACPRSSSSVRAADPNTRWTTTISKTSGLYAASCALEKALQTLESGIMAMRSICQRTPIESGYSTGYLLQSVGVTSRATPRTNTTAPGALASSNNGATIVARSSAMRRRFPAGTTPILRWIGSTSTGGMSPGISALSRAARTCVTSAKSLISKRASENSKRNCRVYDLANAGPRHRFTIMTDAGPLIVSNCILGLGYGMGWAKFQTTIKVQSRANLGEEILLSDADAIRIVETYRSRHNGIASAWRQLNSAGINALVSGGGFEFGPCVFEKERILLPCGLHLHYHGLKLDGEKSEWVYSYGGMPKRTYGGKLMENITQSLARIIVMDAALEIEKRFQREGYPVGLAGQVHDELIYVVPEELVDNCKRIAEEEMCRAPVWAPDLPLGSECDVGDNYADAK